MQPICIISKISTRSRYNKVTCVGSALSRWQEGKQGRSTCFLSPYPSYICTMMTDLGLKAGDSSLACRSTENSSLYLCLLWKSFVFLSYGKLSHSCPFSFTLTFNKETNPKFCCHSGAGQEGRDMKSWEGMSLLPQGPKVKNSSKMNKMLYVLYLTQ